MIWAHSQSRRSFDNSKIDATTNANGAGTTSVRFDVALITSTAIVIAIQEVCAHALAEFHCREGNQGIHE